MKPSTSSAFLAYDLEAIEQQAAYSFSQLQIAGIQNLMAAAAEEIIKIPLDADDLTIPNIKRRAYLQGQIDVLKHLLSLHDAFSQTSQQGN